MDGIARAKANGMYAGKGRPASIDAVRIREMKAQGLGVSATAKALGIAGHLFIRCWRPQLMGTLPLNRLSDFRAQRQVAWGAT
jgi:DNA invertase Pin-like site-specific DNA recombinase